MWYRDYYRPYVSAAERRAKAQRQAAKLAKSGHALAPIELEGTTIARTFWGKAWCHNLESYSDYSNRLPRGRSYIRGGAVLDLQVHPGKVTAMVQGSSLYRQTILIKPLKPATWSRIKTECAGKIDSLIELLQGRMSDAVMRVITRPGDGLFPQPSEIELDCSCPDWAEMCKHVAAALYGVGSRLDQKPELLFVLRGVDHLELVDQAGSAANLDRATAGRKAKTIKTEHLGQIFGIELAEPAQVPAQPQAVPIAVKSQPVAAPDAPNRTAKPRRKSAPRAPNPTEGPKRRFKPLRLSVAGRDRIAQAQRRRWAAFRRSERTRSSRSTAAKE
jgi:uncharacterized Zn finger protein